MKKLYLNFYAYGIFAVSLTACGTKSPSGRDLQEHVHTRLNHAKCIFGLCPEENKNTSTVPVVPGEVLPGPELQLSTYSSCGELQADVKAQLVAKANNEQQRQEYYKTRWSHHKNKIKAAQIDAVESDISADEDADVTTQMQSISATASSAGNTASPAVATEKSAKKNGTFTNVQVKGVDEADRVKIGSHQIYVLTAADIEVVNRQDLRALGKIPLDRASGFAAPTLYVDGENLLVIGQSQRQSSFCPQSLPPVNTGACDDGPLGAGIGLTCSSSSRPLTACTVLSKPVTIVRHYALNANALPTLVREREFTGSLLDSRVTNSRLFLVFRDELTLRPIRLPFSAVSAGVIAMPLADVDPVLLDSRVDTQGDSIAGIKCNTIAKPVVADIDFRMTKVVALNTSNTADEQALGILGGGDHMYMTTKNLYLAKQGLRWRPWDLALEESMQATTHQEQRLMIQRISLVDDGGMRLNAAGSVWGTINDRWAFKEFDDGRILALFTTTSQSLTPIATAVPPSSSVGQTTMQPTLVSQNLGKYHHLWVLTPAGRSLQLINEIHGFGDGEDIRAIRYLDCIAYVVTYPTVLPSEAPKYQIDPLFAFDFIDPAHPKLLSELKVPGFSAYLHPVEKGRLLGVGYDTDSRAQWTVATGVQVSLYDTSDLYNLARIDNHVLGGASSRSLLVPDVRANVVIDAHAFYYDPSRRLIGVPVELSASNDGQAAFSGAVLLRLEANSLSEVARISHANLLGLSSRNLVAMGRDIARLYTIDDRLISVSQIGIASHDWDQPALIKQQLVF